MDRKKQLRQEYKEYKPPMGVFAVVCKPTGKVYLGCAQDLKGTFNSIRFQLEIKYSLLKIFLSVKTFFYCDRWKNLID